MNIVKGALVLLIAAAAFASGYVMRTTPVATAAAHTGERRVLYYVDPMHPAYTANAPGIAPDCGMTLEPVYADTDMDAGSDADAGHDPVAGRPDHTSHPPGSIRVSPNASS